ncbi:glycosyltransferase [uncultured Parasphingorhabdus sp.]|uniref:glycosyltransferase n=1 Tax=uncultured Parasphingorhabdus sp. TaxID=2709694 RepID=UPI0030D6EC47|tara:strand:+ start:135619 stop:136530 length:912 start_codon:yes stop_codon:yes gene_type:complete
MQLPVVAVLLATYNGSAHCRAQLASILWQQGVDVHVYVRDDGSHDATLDIIEEAVNRYPGKITIIDNGGVSTGSANGNFFALLEAVDCSAHPYIALADQDDVWTPDKLLRAIGRLSEAGADGYSSDLIAFDENSNNAWMLHKAGRQAELDYLFQGASAGCTYVLTRHAASVIARVIKAAPPFCEAASHDWIIYAICRSRGMDWVRDPVAEILYRQHANNQYGAKRGWYDISAKLSSVRSKWYRNHVLWLKNIVVGSPVELRVFQAVSHRTAVDRLWLIGKAARFRRASADVVKLRLAIALGIL